MKQIPIHNWKSLDEQQRSTLLSRAESNLDQAIEAVRPIIEDVRSEGDRAVARWTNKFCSSSLAPSALWVSESEFDAAPKLLTAEVRRALDLAMDNIEKFHRVQVPKAMELVDMGDGMFCGERWTPIDSAGLYVPGGRGSFPSMAYMLAIPASLAQVPRLVMTTPPRADGTVDPAILYVASRCGVRRIYKGGGAQAMAALAYGTETVDPVLKLMGPGSAYIAAAKKLLADVVDPGLAAGPSESMIVADPDSDPDTVVLDLFVEAEHGADSSAFLVTWSKSLAIAVSERSEKLLQSSPEPRKGFLESVFSNYGGIILVDDQAQGYEVVNRYGPEHLLIHSKEPWGALSMVRNASEIMLGSALPFSAANYACGPNAILPTSGKAAVKGAVSVLDFMKSSSIIFGSEQSYEKLKTFVPDLAVHEGFQWHQRGFTLRPAKSTGGYQAGSNIRIYGPRKT